MAKKSCRKRRDFLCFFFVFRARLWGLYIYPNKIRVLFQTNLMLLEFFGFKNRRIICMTHLYLHIIMCVGVFFPTFKYMCVKHKMVVRVFLFNNVFYIKLWADISIFFHMFKHSSSCSVFVWKKIYIDKVTREQKFHDFFFRKVYSIIFFFFYPRIEASNASFGRHFFLL